MAKAGDPFGVKAKLTVGRETYTYFSLYKLADQRNEDLSRMPVSIKVLLEAVLRQIDGRTVLEQDVLHLLSWDNPQNQHEITHQEATAPFARLGEMKVCSEPLDWNRTHAILMRCVTWLRVARAPRVDAGRPSMRVFIHLRLQAKNTQEPLGSPERLP